MDFEVYQEDTPEQARFRQEVRDWLGKNVSRSRRSESEEEMTAEVARELEQERRAFRRRLGAQGWLVPTWPKEYGGGGLAASHAAIINEELAHAGAPSTGRDESFWPSLPRPRD